MVPVKKITVALAGTPNVGKSTVFNLLTGLRQYTANWPGKTVEIKEGVREFDGYEMKFVDLPGTYSLTAYSYDEVIARRFIVDGRPDVVVQVIDASTLKKDLYLTLQLLELTDKLIVVLNMMDIAKMKGMEIDIAKLSKILGVPVIPMIAVKGIGIDDLLKKIVEVVEGKVRLKPLRISYGDKVEPLVRKLKDMVQEDRIQGYPTRWLLIKLLEGDKEVIELLKRSPNYINVVSSYNEILKTAPNLSVIIASLRHKMVDTIYKLSVKQPKELRTLSERIDRVVLHKIIGLPILVGVFSTAFLAVFTLGELLSDLASSAFGLVVDFLISDYLVGVTNPLMKSLIMDGVLPAFDVIISFIPMITMFLIVYAVMEDSGYMARAAVIMDRYMHLLGLHGKAFLSVLMGFGCNVPGIMATRGLEHHRDRLIAILVNPLVPCAARLGVMVFIVNLFFEPIRATLVMIWLIALSLLLVALTGALLDKAIVKREFTELIIELPEYHIPSIKNIALLTWVRVKAFVKRACTLIFASVILIWFLYTFPTYEVETSFGAQLGKLLEPLGRLMGLDWKAIVSLIFGLLAKEQVLAAMSVIYRVEEESLGEVLKSVWSPLQALTFLTVLMVYQPCIATIAVIRKETNSWKWTFLSTIYTLLLALVLGILTYNIGSLFLR